MEPYDGGNRGGRRKTADGVRASGRDSRSTGMRAAAFARASRCGCSARSRSAGTGCRGRSRRRARCGRSAPIWRWRPAPSSVAACRASLGRAERPAGRASLVPEQAQGPRRRRRPRLADCADTVSLALPRLLEALILRATLTGIERSSGAAAGAGPVSPLTSWRGWRWAAAPISTAGWSPGGASSEPATPRFSSTSSKAFRPIAKRCWNIWRRGSSSPRLTSARMRSSWRRWPGAVRSPRARSIWRRPRGLSRRALTSPRSQRLARARNGHPEAAVRRRAVCLSAAAAGARGCRGHARHCAALRSL